MSKPERFVRKTLRISQDKLDRAQKILGTRTAAETIDAALDMTMFRQEVSDGLRAIAGTNSLIDIYGEDEEEAGGVHPGHQSLHRRRPRLRAG